MKHNFLAWRFLDAGTPTDGGSGAVIKAIGELASKSTEQTKAVETALLKSIGDMKNELSGEVTDAKSTAQKALEKVEEMEKKSGAKGLIDGLTQQVKSFMQHVTDALTENKENLEKAASSRDGGFKMVIKAANSVLSTGYVSSSPNAYLPVPQVQPGINTAPVIQSTVLDHVATGTSDSPVVTWVNEQPVEGDAAWTAEGALKSQVAWKYTNETSNAKKVTAFIKVTTEALKNIPFLSGRINVRLRELIVKKIREGVLKGDGLNDAPLGIIPRVPAFTTTSFNASVKTPNVFDAIVAMAGQIEELGFDANTLGVVLHGVDIRKMKLEKNDYGYVLPPFYTANGTYVDNVLVIKDNTMAKGYALVGDLSMFEVIMYEDLTIDVGLDGDDFTKNRRTILGEAQIITILSDINKGAFVYSSLATVKTAIAAA